MEPKFIIECINHEYVKYCYERGYSSHCYGWDSNKQISLVMKTVKGNVRKIKISFIDE